MIMIPGSLPMLTYFVQCDEHCTVHPSDNAMLMAAHQMTKVTNANETKESEREKESHRTENIKRNQIKNAFKVITSTVSGVRLTGPGSTTYSPFVLINT